VKKIVIFLVFISLSAWSKVGMILVPDSASVKQGEIARARLLIQATDGTSSLGGMTSKNMDEVLYLYHVGPFMMKQGVLESEVKIIFSKVPTSNQVTEIIQGEQVTISWNDLKVIPTQQSEGFQFGSFEIPQTVKWIPWAIGLLIVSTLLLIIAKFNRRLNQKKRLKDLQSKMKEELLGADGYEGIVRIWEKKRIYLQQFPALEENFRTLEQTLFKFQFKPQRNEFEMAAIKTSYESFKRDISGVLNGI
jgi:hypothetical protein